MQLLSQCTEVRFDSFLSGGFILAIVVNSPEKKVAKCASVRSGPMHALVSGWGKTVTTP